MSVRFPCPACAKPMLLDKVHEGFEVPCPACSHRFLVPVGATDVPTPASDPSPSSSPGDPRPSVRTYPDVTPPPMRYGTVQDDGTTVLVLGILSVVVVPLLGPVAWIMGHKARARARAEGREPSTNVTVGWVFGIIGTVMLLFAGCFIAFLIAAVAGSR